MRAVSLTGARAIGGVQATAKGPKAVERRIVRRLLGRLFGRLPRKCELFIACRPVERGTPRSVAMVTSP
jgi:hypothetical protein